MHWLLIQPELYYFIMAMVFLFVSMIPTPDAKRDYLTALVLSALGIGITIAVVNINGDLFSGTYRVDLFSQVFKSILAMGLFLAISLCSKLKAVDESRHPEFYMLLTVCTLAMMLLVSSVHLLPLYISLELSSYSLYILVFMRKGHLATVSAALKYFLTGAAASAVMLFGIALIYGTAGSAYIADLLQIIPTASGEPSLIIGLVLTLCGFLFKMAVFPFHFWAPDTYESAANEVATFIATASKAAAIAVIMRIISLSGLQSVYFVHLLIALAIITMTLGNLAAMVQKDLKRLLAYSSITHAGYVMLGLLCMSPDGYASAVFYAVTLLILKFTCFMVVVTAAHNGENITMDHLAGLHRREPLLALALMTALFGLAGIPPTIGFSGKLLIFTAAMEKGYFVLILIAMINVVISLYYYLLILKAAYLAEPSDTTTPYRSPLLIQSLAAALIFVIVLAGFFPTYLIELSRVTVQSLI